MLRDKLDMEFHSLGFELSDFRIEGTEFDENTKSRIDKIADTQATHFAAKKVGISYKDMRQLDALDDAASNEGGAAGVLLGANAGDVLSPGLNQPFIASQTDKTVMQRLQHLKELFEAELISNEEYEEKKKSILEEV